MNSETKDEIEFLQMLVRTCRIVRDPKRPTNRVGLSIPAARWEQTFRQRLAELDESKPEVKSKPAEALAA